MSAVLMTLFAVSMLGALAMAGYGLRVLVGRWDLPRQQEALRSVPKLPPLGPVQPPPRTPQPLPQLQLQSQPYAAQPPPAAWAAAPGSAPAPVWVPPAGSAPAPVLMMVPRAVATPPPLRLPTHGAPPPSPPLAFMPPQPGFIATAMPPPPPPLAFMPPQPGFIATGTPPPPPPASAPSPLAFMPPQPGFHGAAGAAPRRAPSPPHRAPSPLHTPITAAAPPRARALSPGSARLARGSIPPDYAAAELAAAPELDAEVDPDTAPGIPLQALASSDAVVQRGARFSVVRSSRR